MSATMQDVAKLAGVSVKTVSNVVNDYPYIRDSTKAKVLAAIADLDYQMNASARSLRSGKTGMIGLAVPELSLPYFAELADSVIQEAERVGLTVLIEQTNGVPERERQALQGARRGLTDGLIFSPLGLSQDDADLLDVSYPLVVLGERIFDKGCDHVTMQNTAAAYAATAYLLSLGCKRIALIGAHEGEVVGSAVLRTQGYLAALADNDIAVDERLIREAGLWHRKTGAEAMTALLADEVEFDAVFALNDALALGALYVLHEHGISVPQQVKLMGFDNIDDGQYSHPPLTSVNPGKGSIAYTAVTMLKERISGAGRGPERREFLTDFEIIKRESTRTDGQ